MSDIGEKESELIAQQNAVEEYLETLLDDGFDEKSSAERAADNIAGLLINTDAEDSIETGEQTEQQTLDTFESTSASTEVTENSESEFELEQMQTPTVDTQVSEIVVSQDDREQTVDIDYRDMSSDPDVIAEAEKMLSYAFPQSQAEENTPLRKLQDAGVIKVVPTDSESQSLETEIDTPVESVPDYASDRFTMMAFRVSGLKLLVSVTELQNVKKVESDLAPVPGKPGWLYQYTKPDGGSAFIAHGGQLCVLDSEALDLKSDLSQKFIVWMLNGQFGVLCDEVEEMIDINRRQVTWRGSKTQQQWCAGTIRSMKAVLLDAKSLWQMIDDQF